MTLPAVRPNVLDRAIAAVSPQRALARVDARRRFLALTGGYEGAKPSRQTRFWRVREMTADEALLPDLPRLRARTADLQRNNPLATGAINTVCTSTLGAGLKVKSVIDRDRVGLSEDQAQEIEASFERDWRLWAESPDCDLTQTQRQPEMQDTVLRSTLTNGDVFSLARYRERRGSPFGLKVQMIAGARVSNPQFVADGMSIVGSGARMANGNVAVAGVEKNQDGVPVAYYVSEVPVGTMPGSLTWARIAATDRNTGLRRMFHHFERLEVDQTRGLPYLAPVVEALRGLGQYSEAELQAAVVGAAYTVFTKTETGQGAAPPVSEGTDPESEIRLEGGTIVDLKPGEDIEIANPGRPNEAFDPFVQAVLRQVGVALELPFEVLIKHFTASYSAARAALLEAWKFFRKKRQWVARSFCQPYYELLLIESVARGRIVAPGLLSGDPSVLQAYFGSEWIGPAPGQLDPAREIQAAQSRIDLDVSTRSREAAEINGSDWEANVRQRSREERVRAELGLGASQGIAGELAPPNDAGDREGPSAPA